MSTKAARRMEVASGGQPLTSSHTTRTDDTTKKAKTTTLTGSRTNRSVMRGVYRLAASSTKMATTVMATPSTATTTSAKLPMRSAASADNTKVSGLRIPPWSNHQTEPYTNEDAASKMARKVTTVTIRLAGRWFTPTPYTVAAVLQQPSHGEYNDKNHRCSHSSPQQRGHRRPQGRGC
jgi:hypothetical protein